MKRALPALITALLCALLPLAAAAVIPVPPYRGWVTDDAGIIPPAERNRIESLIQSVKDQSGAEIAVLTVPTTDGEDIFGFAMRVAEAWKPGVKGKDNGVVFVVASEDRKMYILVGYGLEGVLPDGKVGAIQDDYVVPAFKAGDYAAGIEAGVRELARTLAPGLTIDESAGAAGPGSGANASGQTSYSGRPPTMWNLIKIGLLAIFFLYMLIFHPRLLLFMLMTSGGGRRRGGGFGGGFKGFGGGGFGGGGAGRSW